MIRRSTMALVLVLVCSVLAGCYLPGSPFGAVESVSEDSGSARLIGWAVDPDRPLDVATVRIYLDGEPVRDVSADVNRPDVDTGVEGSGMRHGFDVTVPLGSRGSHDVCAFAVNVEEGSDLVLLGCETVRVGGADPQGSLDQVGVVDGGLRIQGWALDADVTRPIVVEVTSGSRLIETLTADVPRPGLELFFPDHGPAHGFAVTVPDNGSLIAPTYCVHAVDHADPGRRIPLGCRTRPADLVTVGGIEVARGIADDLAGLLLTAGPQGISLSGGGYRSPERQIELRRQNCGTSPYAVWDMPSSSCSPPTARPGRSLHEQGLAIDFRCGGSGIGSRSSPCYQWLAANAATFGFYNLPSEPWHWSVNGS